jgi:citrate lyase beta subunit
VSARRAGGRVRASGSSRGRTRRSGAAGDAAPRARRTLLFVPGDDPRKIGHAADAGADTVILDLEDGVALDRKREARESIATALREVKFGRSERLVRINPIGSGLEAADVAALRRAPPDGWVVPKVATAAAVRAAARLTAAAPGPLLALIESARGVANLQEIAAAHPRLRALLFGAEDLAGDMGAVRTPGGQEVAWARGAVVLQAAAAGLQAIDTIFADLRDEEGLRLEALLAARMGYTGKMAIHPGQLDAIAAAFTPTDEEVARARRLVEAHTRHQAAGRGVFSLDGRMVDMPMVRAAERVLARARAPGRR